MELFTLKKDWQLLEFRVFHRLWFVNVKCMVSYLSRRIAIHFT
jgi:hypothetical protein